MLYPPLSLQLAVTNTTNNVTANMTLSGVFRFNSRNQIIAYDVNFLRFPEFLANLYGDILLNNRTQTFLDLYGPPSVGTATAVCQYAVRC